MSALSDLAAELGMGPDALRSAILSGGEDEALTPNYLTTNPDGTTSADFTGRVHAQGLDLDAVETGLATSMVRWLTATGVVGDMVTEITGPTAFTDIQTTSPDGTRQGYIEILQSNGGAVAPISDYIRATLELGGAVKQADILRGDGSSDFVQNDPTRNTRTWNALTPLLTTGWTQDGNYAAPQYSKDPLGVVTLRGVLDSTGATLAAFFLPAGFRPPVGRRFPFTYATVGGTTAVLGVLDLFATGEARMYSNSFTTIPMNFASLDGISFPTT